MKRSPALQSLSRDHHKGLAVSLTLRRATLDTTSQARLDFLDYWSNHAALHFRCEEEILLPAFAQAGDTCHPLVMRVLLDHLTIRALARQLAEEPGRPLDLLQSLGLQLSDHIRLEERQLFPLIEDTLGAQRLAQLAVELDEAEQRHRGHARRETSRHT